MSVEDEDAVHLHPASNLEKIDGDGMSITSEKKRR